MSFSSKKWILVLLALIINLGLGGCFKSSRPSFSPDLGEDEVPLNTAVRIEFVSGGCINEGFIRPESFSMTSCASSPQISETTDGEEEDDGEVPPPRTVETGEEIPGQLAHRCYADEAGNQITEIFFVPIPARSAKSPLQENMRYCFNVKPLKDINGEETLAGSTSFRTEELSDFGFSDRANVITFYPRDEPESDSGLIGGREWVGMTFVDQGEPVPVHPRSVQAGTTACLIGDLPQPDSGKSVALTPSQRAPLESKRSEAIASLKPWQISLDLMKRTDQRALEELIKVYEEIDLKASQEELEDAIKEIKKLNGEFVEILYAMIPTDDEDPQNPDPKEDKDDKTLDTQNKEKAEEEIKASLAESLAVSQAFVNALEESLKPAASSQKSALASEQTRSRETSEDCAGLGEEVRTTVDFLASITKTSSFYTVDYSNYAAYASFQDGGQYATQPGIGNEAALLEPGAQGFFVYRRNIETLSEAELLKEFIPDGGELLQRLRIPGDS